MKIFSEFSVLTTLQGQKRESHEAAESSSEILRYARGSEQSDSSLPQFLNASSQSVRQIGSRLPVSGSHIGKLYLQLNFLNEFKHAPSVVSYKPLTDKCSSLKVF